MSTILGSVPTWGVVTKRGRAYVRFLQELAKLFVATAKAADAAMPMSK